MFVLVSANLALRWYPQVLPQYSKSVYYVLGAVSCVALFLCVLAHELSHSFVAKKEGAEVRGIVLHVFGGVSLINETKYTPGMEFRVAAAGPLLSVFLGAAFWAIRKVFIEHSIAYEFLSYLFFINVSLAVFNLLPAFPLDGGRLLRALLALWKRDLLKATKIASRVGTWFAFLLMGYGVVGLLSGNFWGIWTVLIGIFLKDAAQMSFRQMLMRDAFRQGTVADIMQNNPVVVPSQITIQELIDEYFWRYHHGSFPVGDDKALGIVSFKDVKKIPQERRGLMRVNEIMYPIQESMRIKMEDTILSAFEKATQNGIGRLIVVDFADRILGYISLRDIASAFRDRTNR